MKFQQCWAWAFIAIVAWSQDVSAFNPDNSSAVDCGPLKRKGEMLIGELHHSCRMLQDCLVRRDTCMAAGRPATQALCGSANECMQTNENGFNDQAQCRYEWSTSNPAAPFCAFKATPLRVQDGCPGRVLRSPRTRVDLNEFDLPADLRNSETDLLANCEGVNRTYKAQVFAIRKTIQRITESCQYGNIGLITRISNATRPGACPASENFSASLSGEFALPAGNNTGIGVHAGPRGGAGELPEANPVLAPTAPDTVPR